MSRSTLHLHSGEGDVYDVLGVEHRILLGSEESDGQVALVEVSIPPGGGSPPHIDRREALVWYVVDGAVTFETEAGPVTLEAGGAILMERNSWHGFANGGDRPARGLLFAVPAGIEGFFREAASVLPAGGPEGPPPPDVANRFAEVAERYGIELASGEGRR